MCGKTGSKRTQAWTLVEMSVAMAIFSICGLAVASLWTFTARSFAALSNYAILDQANRQAMDKLTYEIREAKHVVNYTVSPPTLTLLNGVGTTVIYSFNPNTLQMVRDASDGAHEILLNNCQLLNFELFKRVPSNGVYGSYPTTTTDWKNTAKVLVLSWKTSMAISPTARVTSENVQTARIVIRNAQTYD